ncbi:hypothetical protein [Desulfocurvus sp.]|uniref:hypothetical protein n=1 Tax=Desulfocurvus sp. TaxID=2871698 RepID=UPI0025BB7914|nr:hypothetical protein [Desulfocurvus sp.]MCK9241448.1 hypothetical protein [Desulfocurvus sp.]
MQLPEPSPALAAVFLLLALHLCAVYVGLGAFALAWWCEALGAMRRMAFLKKLARQLSGLGVLFLCYTVAAVAGGVAVLWVRFPETLWPWTAVPELAAPPALALAWTLLFALAYALTWPSAREHQGRHRALGLFAALGGPLLLGTSLAMKLAPLNPWYVAAGPHIVMLRGVFVPAFGPLLAASALTMLACAAGFGQVYLLLRRNRDDFGRDYYGFALGRLAGWALPLGLAAAGAQAWACTRIPGAWPPGAQGPALLAAGGLGALGLACALWAVVWRASAPLRMKPAVWLAALALLGATGAFAALQATLFLPAPAGA